MKETIIYNKAISQDHLYLHPTPSPTQHTPLPSPHLLKTAPPTSPLPTSNTHFTLTLDSKQPQH